MPPQHEGSHDPSSGAAACQRDVDNGQRPKNLTSFHLFQGDNYFLLPLQLAFSFSGMSRYVHEKQWTQHLWIYLYQSMDNGTVIGSKEYCFTGWSNFKESSFIPKHTDLSTDEGESGARKGRVFTTSSVASGKSTAGFKWRHAARLTLLFSKPIESWSCHGRQFLGFRCQIHIRWISLNGTPLCICLYICVFYRDFWVVTISVLLTSTRWTRLGCRWFCATWFRHLQMIPCGEVWYVPWSKLVLLILEIEVRKMRMLSNQLL